MKELAFVTALVLILCGIVYWSRQSAGTGQDAAANTTFESAINSAKAVKGVANAGARRRWVMSLQLTATQGSDEMYSTEGNDADVLVVTSNDFDNTSCLAFANGEHGSAAAAVGFTGVDCRNSSNGATYKIPLALTQ